MGIKLLRIDKLNSYGNHNHHIIITILININYNSNDLTEYLTFLPDFIRDRISQLSSLILFKSVPSFFNQTIEQMTALCDDTNNKSDVQGHRRRKSVFDWPSFWEIFKAPAKNKKDPKGAEKRNPPAKLPFAPWGRWWWF